MEQILTEKHLSLFWNRIKRHEGDFFTQKDALNIWNKFLELIDHQNAFLISHNFDNIEVVIECLNWFNDSYSKRFMNLKDAKKYLFKWALFCDYNSTTPYKIPITYGNTVQSAILDSCDIQFNRAKELAQKSIIGFIIQAILDEFDTMETISLEKIHSSYNFPENQFRLDGTRHHEKTHTTQEDVWVLQFSPEKKYTYRVQAVYANYEYTLEGVYTECSASNACNATCMYVLIACTKTETCNNNCTVSDKTKTTPIHMRMLLPQ